MSSAVACGAASQGFHYGDALSGDLEALISQFVGEVDMFESFTNKITAQTPGPVKNLANIH